MSPAFLTQKQIELTRLLKNLRGVRNDVAEPTLSAITVFDRDAASVHVQKKNEVWFRPFGLDIPDDLAGVCQELKARLLLEKEAIERQRNNAFINPIWSNRSSIGQALSALRHDTELSSLTPTEELSDADEARLTNLQTDLAQDGAVSAAKQRESAARLEQMNAYLKKLEAQFCDSALEVIVELYTKADEARSAASVAATDAFSGLQLTGVGEKIWRSLWESARSYSQSIGNEAIPFPPTRALPRVARIMSVYLALIQTQARQIPLCKIGLLSYNVPLTFSWLS